MVRRGSSGCVPLHPYSVAVDPATGSTARSTIEYNCVVRKVDSAKTITTIAGIADLVRIREMAEKAHRAALLS